MGMFDTVIIEDLKLKASPEVNSFLKENKTSLPTEFQTKDLDNVLTTYKINNKYQLFANNRKETGKKVPYEPFAGWKDNRSFLEKIYFKYFSKYRDLSNTKTPRLVPEVKYVWEKEKITNTFEIYAYEEIGGRYLDLTYTVKAIDGEVKSIKFKEANIEPLSESKKRKERNAEFDDKMKEHFARRKEFTSKWYYPILKETYNPFIFFVRLIVQSVCNKIIQLTYKWNGV